MNALEVLWQYRAAFASGFLVTIELVLTTAFVGTLLGVTLEWAGTRFGMVFRWFSDAIAFAISTVPALVLLFWLYYPAQSVLGFSASPFVTALAALVVMNTFAIYRIVADAVQELPKQFITSALVCGLSQTKITRYIRTPLLIRAILPRWIDQQVLILQTSVFASLISVEEVFRAAQRINSVVYQPVLIYTAMAFVFLLTAGSAMLLAKYFREKYYRDFSER